MAQYYIFSRITIISAISLEILHEILPNDENTREKLGPVRVCRFSPDGKMLAKGHDTGVIEVRPNVISPLPYESVDLHNSKLYNRRIEM